MFGDRNELLVPALIGLGIFAQNSEMNLANNTSILLILFLLLRGDEHREGHHDGDRHCCCEQRRPSRIERQLQHIDKTLCRIECCACNRGREHHHDRDRDRDGVLFV